MSLLLKVSRLILTASGLLEELLNRADTGEESHQIISVLFTFLCDRYPDKSNSREKLWACNSRERKPITGRHTAGVRGRESRKEDRRLKQYANAKSFYSAETSSVQNGDQERNSQDANYFLEGLGNLFTRLAMCGSYISTISIGCYVSFTSFGLKEIPDT